VAKTCNPHQRALNLTVEVREPTKDDLRAAYEQCVRDKARLSFEMALELVPYTWILKNAAKAAILRRGGR
jgi:hypothetical protein